MNTPIPARQRLVNAAAFACAVAVLIPLVVVSFACPPLGRWIDRKMMGPDYESFGVEMAHPGSLWGD